MKQQFQFPIIQYYWMMQLFRLHHPLTRDVVQHTHTIIIIITIIKLILMVVEGGAAIIITIIIIIMIPVEEEVLLIVHRRQVVQLDQVEVKGEEEEVDP